MVTTDQYILFFSYKDIYSNFYKSQFSISNKNFFCTEQAFMYAKAKKFNDIEIADKILSLDSSTNPSECKKLGRLVKNYDDHVWTIIRKAIMYQCVLAKFSQNDNLKQQLIATGSRVIAEASPYDKIWGIGLAEDNPMALDHSKWIGQNLLGKVLMNVRNNLI